jgi:hypothetical protein
MFRCRSDSLPDSQRPLGSIDLGNLLDQTEARFGSLMNGTFQHVMYFTGAKPDETTDPGVEGIALLGTLCTPSSVSLVTLRKTRYDQQDLVPTVAHEFGHSIGLTHDGGNGCPEKPVYIMGGEPPDAYDWSACSKAQAEKWMGCFGCLIGTTSRPPLAMRFML